MRLLVDSYGNFEAYYTVIAEGDKEETKELKVVEIYKSYMKCNTKLEYVKNISSLVLKIQY